ncbi:DNA repair protein RecO [Lactobacillus sp. S2-2]|nr:DNA repair protein RecO [Lactobacillus sp. S2-2]MCF6514987.1 DNA repair protein RecO [Lactobacillus sp. S2-2]
MYNTSFHGILMYRKDYKDNDMLVKFFTAEYGKKMFFVRGAKKKNFKMTSDILPFTYGEYTGNINDDGLSYILNASDTNHFKNITNDIFYNAYVTYIISLIDAAFPDSLKQVKWFNNLFYAQQHIDNGLDPEIITNLIELQLLPEFGVAQNFKDCVICGRNDLKLDYSESYGGLLCQNHFELDKYRISLDNDSLFYLKSLSETKIIDIKKIDVEKNTKKVLRQVIDKIYDNSVGINLKSKKFIDQMDQWSLKLKMNRRD